MEKRKNNNLHPLFDVLVIPQECNKVDSLMEGLALHPFYFELSKCDKNECFEPWKDNRQAIIILEQLWGQTSIEIKSYFSNRDRERARKPMVYGIGLLLSFIYWTNGMMVPFAPTTVVEKLKELKWKPVNSEERIRFLFDKPNHYHSFIQLTELFTETKKLFYKLQHKNRIS